jgi:hypothetical protein
LLEHIQGTREKEPRPREIALCGTLTNRNISNPMSTRQQAATKPSDDEEDGRRDEVVDGVSSSVPHMTRSAGEGAGDHDRIPIGSPAIRNGPAVVQAAISEETENDNVTRHDEKIATSEQSTPPSPLCGEENNMASKDEINNTEGSDNLKPRNKQLDAFPEPEESSRLEGKSINLIEKKLNQITDAEELPLPALVRQGDVKREPVIGAVAVRGPNITINNSVDGGSSDDTGITAGSTANDTVVATPISSSMLEMEVRKRIIQEAAEATIVMVGDDDDNNRRITVDDEDTRHRKRKRTCMIIVCGTILALVLLAAAAAIGVVVGMREEEDFLESPSAITASSPTRMPRAAGETEAPRG